MRGGSSVRLHQRSTQATKGHQLSQLARSQRWKTAQRCYRRTLEFGLLLICSWVKEPNLHSGRGHHGPVRVKFRCREALEGESVTDAGTDDAELPPRVCDAKVPLESGGGIDSETTGFISQKDNSLGEGALLVNARTQGHGAAKPQPKGPGQVHESTVQWKAACAPRAAELLT